MSNHVLILSSFFFLDEMVLPLISGEVLYKTCLGEGSYGPVYSGVWHQEESSIPCAIKFPNCQAPSSLQASTRVKREAELVLTLIHPNLVQHLEVVLDSNADMPIFLMELMESNLTHYLQNTPTGLPLHTQVNLCCDIAFGLAYLHSHSIVHGNLTSSNVLMKGERAKIDDFVIGRLTGSQAVKQEGSDLSEPSDVYSYGLLMIQIITGKSPLSDYSHISLSPPPTTTEMDADHTTLTHQADSTSNSALLSVPSGHILGSVVHSCLGDSMHRPTADTITKHLFSLSHHPEYQTSSSESASNAQQEIEKLTLKHESMKTEVTTLHENFVTELKEAEEKSKVLEAKLKQKETELKSCVSENKRLKNDVKTRKQAEKESQKLLREHLERTKVLETENKKQKETIQELHSQVKTSREELQQSKNEMKAKLASIIEEL